MNFTTFKPVHQVESGDTDYADAVNHLKNYSSYIFKDSIATSVHECTHGINADLRNGAITQITSVGPGTCRLIKPTATEQSNAFYCLKDRAIKIAEPNGKKSDCIPFIPKALQRYRFQTYVTGQKEWDGQPLYIFDEYIAYINGAHSVVQRGKGNVKEDGQDYIGAPLEFVAYGIATTMAAVKNGSNDQLLLDFTRWLIATSFNLYFQGIDIMPWEDANKNYQQLLSGSECGDIRAFMKEKLNLKVPTTVIDPDVPGPNSVDWVM